LNKCLPRTTAESESLSTQINVFSLCGSFQPITSILIM